MNWECEVILPGKASLLARVTGSGRYETVQAVPGDGWIRLRKAWPGEVTQAVLAGALLSGAAFPAGTRLVLDGAGELMLEGEAPAIAEDEDVDPAEEIGALAGVMESLNSLPGGAASERRPILESVTDVLRSAGDWTVHERADGLVLDLDTRDGLVQVRLTATDAELLAEIEVLRGDAEWSSCSLAGMAVLLLSESGRLRLVRPCAAAPAGADPEIWFQVALPLRQLSPARVRDALGALAVAWDEVVEEAAVLQSPAAAARYLAKRGFAGSPD